ncbi:MAG: hypothetical protein C4523_18960 [Myxococcales bacterium]|nr:MAG: hypothetical protein C4523_18960 [Myxococcales bacterium]
MRNQTRLLLPILLWAFTIPACSGSDIVFEFGDPDAEETADSDPVEQDQAPGDGDEDPIAEQPDSPEIDIPADIDNEEIIDGDGSETADETAEAEFDEVVDNEMPTDGDFDPETVDGDWTDSDLDLWVDIEAVSAPDERTVSVLLSEDWGGPASEESSYSITSDRGPLSVLSVDYQPLVRTATLTTGKQKLGVTYTLSLNGGRGTASADFIAADFKEFYAIDFADYSQIQVGAFRVAVGENAVIYAQEDYDFPNAEAFLDEFDAQIYPRLTALMTGAPDFDGNGKIVIFGLDGGDYYGGYFDPTNQYSDRQTMEWWGMHSNEMEMVHINVLTEPSEYGHVIAHEFNHLLYHERHGLQYDYFEYHDEGLAECAVHAVYGDNDYAVLVYQYDPRDVIRNGLSLVNWQYAQYENYALAYLFWTYLAGRTGGVEQYGTFFDLDDGDPGAVNELIQELLDTDFNSVQFDSLIANWVQDDSGPYGYNGMFSASAASAPVVWEGTSSVDLEPFAGAFFRLAGASVDYPGTQGAHIVYAGIDNHGNVDKAAPFAVNGGALLVYNKNFLWDSFPSEPSGPDQPSIGGRAAGKHLFSGYRSFMELADPPPVPPSNRRVREAWRKAVELRRAK